MKTERARIFPFSVSFKLYLFFAYYFSIMCFSFFFSTAKSDCKWFRYILSLIFAWFAEPPRVAITIYMTFERIKGKWICALDIYVCPGTLYIPYIYNLYILSISLLLCKHTWEWFDRAQCAVTAFTLTAHYCSTKHADVNRYDCPKIITHVIGSFHSIRVLCGKFRFSISFHTHTRSTRTVISRISPPISFLE